MGLILQNGSMLPHFPESFRDASGNPEKLQRLSKRASSSNHWFLGIGRTTSQECPDAAQEWADLACQSLYSSGYIRGSMNAFGNHASSSWQIAERGSTGHAGIAFFNTDSCSGSAIVSFKDEQDGCVENLKYLSVLPFAY